MPTRLLLQLNTRYLSCIFYSCAHILIILSREKGLIIYKEYKTKNIFHIITLSIRVVEPIAHVTRCLVPDANDKKRVKP